MPAVVVFRAAPRGRLPWVLMIGFASFAASFVRAQTGPIDPGDPAGWLNWGAARLAPSVSFDWTTTDNVFRVPPEGAGAAGVGPQSSGLMQVSSDLKLLLPYSQSRLEIDFRPVYRDYTQVSLQEKYGHDISLRNLLVLSNGMDVDLTLRRSRGAFEANDFDAAGQINFSTTPYRANEAAVEWTWTHPSHWATVVSVNADAYSFDNEAATTDSSGNMALLFDNVSLGGAVDLEWIVQPRVSVFAGVGSIRSRVEALGEDDNGNGILDPVEEGDSDGGPLLVKSQRFTQEDLRLGVRGQIGPWLRVDSLLARTSLSSRDTGQGQFSGFTTRVDVRAQVSRSSSLSLQIDRQPQQTLTSRSEVFVYRTQRLAWSATGLRNFVSVGVRSVVSRLEDRRETLESADVSWGIRLRRWLTLRAGLVRSNKRSNLPSLEYDETRATVGWSVGWQ